MSLFFLFIVLFCTSFFFFFNDTATTEIYTLSLHDALPISFSTDHRSGKGARPHALRPRWKPPAANRRRRAVAGKLPASVGRRQFPRRPGTGTPTRGHRRAKSDHFDVQDREHISHIPASIC